MKRLVIYIYLIGLLAVCIHTSQVFADEVRFDDININEMSNLEEGTASSQDFADEVHFDDININEMSNLEEETASFKNLEKYVSEKKAETESRATVNITAYPKYKYTTSPSDINWPNDWVKPMATKKSQIKVNGQVVSIYDLSKAPIGTEIIFTKMGYLDEEMEKAFSVKWTIKKNNNPTDAIIVSFDSNRSVQVNYKGSAAEELEVIEEIIDEESEESLTQNVLNNIEISNGENPKYGSAIYYDESDVTSIVQTSGGQIMYEMLDNDKRVRFENVSSVRSSSLEVLNKPKSVLSFRTASPVNSQTLLYKTVTSIETEYPKPYVTGYKEDEKYVAQYNVKQVLPLQPAAKYSDLEIKMDINPILELNSQTLNKIKITNLDDETVTAAKTIKDNLLTIRILSSTLQKLRQNKLNIELEFNVDLANPNLKDYIEGSYLVVPLTAYNNKAEGNSTDNAYINISNTISGVPIPQEVILGTNTSDLELSDLVEELSSQFENDEVFVDRFEEEKVFDSIGDTTIVVVIKSKLTGIEREIIVPIHVILGEVKLESVPDKLDFGVNKIKNYTQTLFPKIEEELIISDNRGNNKNYWRLTLREKAPLSSNTNNLSGLMYYTNAKETVNIGNNTTVVEERKLTESETVNISSEWQENKGISLKIPVEKQIFGEYNGTLSWSLEDVPE
ncbi:hypothetical protein IGL98_003412 [Enterococcus sp. DIV0840]|uniref:WxL domain-containing protein n=1 Tax=unclassified Enterococcus TaxID=2608891 RepID=UPI001A8E5EB4|nr:WxL domain-containing protein [Enterococcus sp. DIV0849a]MBO0433157.1 WxL domain-containing protein [Enterococcus sp. DIV0849a]